MHLCGAAFAILHAFCVVSVFLILKTAWKVELRSLRNLVLTLNLTICSVPACVRRPSAPSPCFIILVEYGTRHKRSQLNATGPTSIQQGPVLFLVSVAAAGPGYVVTVLPSKPVS